MGLTLPKKDHSPLAARPWLIPERLGCIRFDDESARESQNFAIMIIGLAVILFGTYGCEPKRFHYANSLHTSVKMWMLFGSLSGLIFSFWLRAKRAIGQIIGALVVVGFFGKAIHLVLVHGSGAIPTEYFFPNLIKLGLFAAAFGGIHLMLTDDFLLIDLNRRMVFQHSEFFFKSREIPLCELGEIRKVEIVERLSTHKNVTSVFYRVGLTLNDDKQRLNIQEVAAGTTKNLTFSQDIDQIVALAVALAGASGQTVEYPASFPHHMRQQLK